MGRRSPGLYPHTIRVRVSREMRDAMREAVAAAGGAATISTIGRYAFSITLVKNRAGKWRMRLAEEMAK